MKTRVLLSGLVLLLLAQAAPATDFAVRFLPRGAARQVEELAANGSTVRGVTITPDGAGWVILYDQTGYSAHGAPDEATKVIGMLARKGSVIKSVTFTA